MKKFQVLFKDLKKQFNVDSQDEETAKAWGEKQLAFWGEKSRVSVTPIIVAVTPPAPAKETKGNQ